VFLVFAVVMSPGSVIASTCSALFNKSSDMVTFLLNEGLGLSQAHRLHLLLLSMTPDQRGQLYQALNVQNMNQLSRVIREHDTDAMPAELVSFLKDRPGLDIFFLDLVGFGHSFPGIFALKEADPVVFRVLESVRQKELSDVMGTNRDVLASQALAPRLSRSIDDMLVSLIRQGNSEGSGHLYGRGFWSRTGYRIRRWFSPSYKKVEYAVETAKFFQRQLHRYRLVDQLIVRNALADAVRLGLTEKEVGDLASLVLDSPKEIREIEKLVKQIFHSEFAIGKFIQEGQFNIDAIYKRAREVDLAEIMREYDGSTVEALKKLNDVLSNAQERAGQKPRAANEYDIKELRLFFGAYRRGMDRNELDYDRWVGTTSNETYRVEDRRTERVASGKDSKGNTTYRTRVYYTDRTVRPSFNTLIHGGYDTGDRSVSGLSSVQANAARMTARELPSSEKIEAYEASIEEALSRYSDVVLKGDMSYAVSMQNELPVIAERIAELKEYLAWSDQQILAQYRNDNVDVFRGRNREMVERYENMYELMGVLSELFSRGELQREVAFDLWDYSSWMQPMRDKRRANFTQKAVIGTAVVGGTAAYVISPEVQQSVDLWLQNAASNIQHILSFEREVR
jgi:hypothetical protein